LVQHKLDTASGQRASCEESLLEARGKMKELETELFLCKESLSKAKDEFSKQTIEHSASLSHSQSELMKLALDLSSSRHEVEEKTAELRRKSIELEDLRSRLMEAQSNIDFLLPQKK
jgi:predicted  nucleic acid-binding Zn-ribbon protein